MPWRPHGRARVDPKRPEAWAVDDRSGFVTNLRNLRWQYAWRGPRLMRIPILVTQKNYDIPNEQRRPIVLPPDPIPVKNPRPENFILEDIGISATQASTPPFATPTPVPTPFIGPIDTLPQSAASLSLRLTTATYTGPCLQLRNSGGQTANIGFSGGTLNTTQAASFIGNGSGFVITWYDQSGFANNATQSSQAHQPQLILSATPTGRPTIRFTVGSQMALTMPSSATIDNFLDGGGYIASAARPSGAGSFPRLFSKGEITLIDIFGAGVTDYELAKMFTTTEGAWYQEQSNSAVYTWLVYGAQYNDLSAANQPTMRLYGTNTGSGPTGQFFGVSAPVGTRLSDAGSSLVIGNRAGLDRGWDGDMMEMIFWNGMSGAPTVPQQTSLESNMIAWWGAA